MDCPSVASCVVKARGLGSVCGSALEAGQCVCVRVLASKCCVLSLSRSGGTQVEWPCPVSRPEAFPSVCRRTLCSSLLL